MKKSTKTIEIKVERTISASLVEVFDGYLGVAKHFGKEIESNRDL